MVQPLENVRLEVVGFGGELILIWDYPAELPNVFKPYLFKRSKVDVTQQEIDSYFENIDDLSQFNYNGLFVNDNLTSEHRAVSDITVINETQYYYKLVLRDEESGEVSVPVAVNGKPAPTLKVNVKDGKDIVYKAIKKMLDNLYSLPNQKTALGKDIQIVKNFSIEPIGTNWIMIERVNGSTQYRYWANEIATLKAGKVKGDIDIDVIRATFITTDSPERRDTITNIFRANKQFLIRLCKKLGALNCNIDIEGDYYNPQIHGLNATGCIVVFSLLIENHALIPAPELTALLGEMDVETN